MTPEEKREIYRRVHSELAALLDGLDDPIAVMASTAAVLHAALPYVSWTGFYRVVGPDLLRIGPYQGPVGCLEIGFGKGVCGTAAARRTTLIVDDVHAFDGHIACDPDSRSEIVVPVEDEAGNLAAVLDLDSHQPSAFDEADREGLSAAVRLLRRSFAT